MATLIECKLCPRHCRIGDGQRGNCRVRSNIDGKLFTLVYGKPCAIHIDPIEKKPFYHVLPATSSFSIATAGCNLHCKYCQNWQISQNPPEQTENVDLSPQAAVDAAIKNRCRSIAYTYSDPVIFYEYAVDISRLAKSKGILNVHRTAGYIEKEPLEELCAVTDAINVDFKGITEDFYRGMSEATLAPVLDAMKTIRKWGVWLELTNLVVPTWNDREEDIKNLCRWIVDNLGAQVPLHFSRFWPMHQLKNLPPTPVATLERAYEIARKEGLHFCYIGNIPDHSANNTYCPNDGKVLVRRIGFTVLENNIVGGKCKFCNTAIPGIWS
ncbi:MAG TPA: AmmeMemoRadiSam system radical SAM enzyme [Candidatus Omnitrophota bacterium]|nr:AmmeMemoRadiSam system radical SAM enzyme [Candidatus Omnitrophota bacterium]HPD84451.1 AmmeMemoRadiSam system radical SAM enzyme [Candidatus Omnitrophota bacterium]HRZ03309.1 AmmeMemoRadiSam system radical SAM enzyme [Candidatus Omnitrophota bacterium]